MCRYRCIGLVQHLPNSTNNVGTSLIAVYNGRNLLGWDWSRYPHSPHSIALYTTVLLVYRILSFNNLYTLVSPACLVCTLQACAVRTPQTCLVCTPQAPVRMPQAISAYCISMIAHISLIQLRTRTESFFAMQSSTKVRQWKKTGNLMVSDERVTWP